MAETSTAQAGTKVQAPEKQTNCLSCAKPIKKLKKYYRDGKYYCSKKCWRKSIKAKLKKNEKTE